MALICSAELNKTSGITLTVTNGDANPAVTQTVTMDGSSITLICGNGQTTSSIQMTVDSVTVNCRNFTVQADSIDCTSTKDTVHTAQGKYTINSTDNAAFNSQAQIAIAAASDLDASGSNITATAQSAAKITGSNTTIKGEQNATVSGAQLDLAAQSSARLTGSSITVQSQAALDMEGLTTTVKGTTTNIQGSVVNLG